VARLLTDLLAALRDSLGIGERAQLDSTQSSWSSYTSVQCRLANSDNHDGSAYSMLVSLCRASYVTARIKELAPLLCSRTQMADLPCPVADRYIATSVALRP
jgi:uncharacterized protein YecT (DUF1311 family)